MESYYSSDEEIAWGPVTLKEIKGDLKRPIRKPKKRHTIHLNLNMASEQICCNLLNKESEDVMLRQEESAKLNISTTSTEYLTPNESLRANNNSNFIEKLSKVINESHSDLSVYNSVLEHSESSSTSIQTNNANDRKSSNLASEPALNDTHLNFIKSAKERKTTYDIANFQQTLIENSMILSEVENMNESECSNIVDRMEDLSVDYNLTQEKITADLDESQCSSVEDRIDFSVDHSLVQEKSTDEDIIVISDDEENIMYNNTNEEDKIENIKTEISFETETSESSFEMDRLQEEPYRYLNVLNKSSNFKTVNSEDNADNREGNESNLYSKESSEVQHRYELEQNKYADDVYRLSDQLPKKLSTIEEKEYLNTSVVSVPEIDLKQFDDSYNDSLDLNDTLEEINRALKQGLEYRMSDEENVIEETPVKNDKPELIFTPANITSSCFLLKPQLDGATGVKENTHKTPLKSMQPTSTEKNRKFGYQPKMSPDPKFKVPNMKLGPKLLHPPPRKGVSCHTKSLITPPKSAVSNFKNIVSPVALYIKNSPSVKLKQNVPPKVLSKIPTPEPVPKQINTKEMLRDFPDVVYKPAKNQLARGEKEIVIPPSLRKLNVREPHLVKHEGRVKQSNLNRTAVNAKLLDSNITNDSIDLSALNSSRDISVLTNKQAFIK